MSRTSNPPSESAGYDVYDLGRFLAGADNDLDDAHPDCPTISIRESGPVLRITATTAGYTSGFVITIAEYNPVDSQAKG